MNKLVIILSLFLLSFTVKAQYAFHKVDVTAGVLAPVLGYGIVNVEYSLTDMYTINLQVTKDFNKKEYSDVSLSYGDLSLSPAFRYYPSDNEAKSFFFEAFLKYKTLKLETGNTSVFGGGLGFGYKKVLSWGLIFGSNLGIGYGTNEAMLRGALFVGWRI